MATLKYKNGDSWIDILHPIGSFYFSNSDESPSVLFGGTWTQITGAAIRGDSITGYTGSDTCTLTVDEIPAHRHGIQQTYNVGSGVGSTVPAWNSHYFNTQYTDYSGGGQHIQSCSAPTIAIFGTEQRNFSSFGGEVICLGLIF